MRLTNGHKLVRGVLPCGSNDGRGATRMVFEELCAIVYLAVEYKPRIVLHCVLLDLLEADLPVDVLVHHDDHFVRLYRSLHTRYLIRVPLSPISVGQVPTFVLHPLHPPTGHQSWLCGMLEP